MKNETVTIIYRHPKGRFVVVERRGIGRLGGEYRIRETVFLRLKQQEYPPVQKAPASRITQEEQYRFVELFKQYRNVDKVSEKCGRSRSAVFKVLKKVGLIPKPKHLTDGDKATIEALTRSGMSHQKIGAVIGFSQTVVSRYLRESSLKLRK